jgi:hypothetical protein
MGTIISSIGAALAACFAILGYTGAADRTIMHIGIAVGCAIALVGMAMFLSSRYAARPPDQGNGTR